jgi:hypothetical protein
MQPCFCYFDLEQQPSGCRDSRVRYHKQGSDSCKLHLHLCGCMAPSTQFAANCAAFSLQTHTWAEPPSDTAAYAKWQQDGNNKSLSGRRPLSAGRCSDRAFTADKDSVGGLLRQHSSRGRSSSSSSGGGGSQDSARSASTGRRKVRSMDTW